MELARQRGPATAAADGQPPWMEQPTDSARLLSAAAEGEDGCPSAAAHDALLLRCALQKVHWRVLPPMMLLVSGSLLPGEDAAAAWAALCCPCAPREEGGHGYMAAHTGFDRCCR
jgi:hypothetical protein